ncbi:MAG TPA: O-antigen ligase family protein, partial [Ktedonobacteraceae bacterium]|nr:O-antigen ligase family protein [Ktedonobacteraceae bacterium]
MNSQDLISASDSSQDQDPQDASGSDVQLADHPPVDHRRGWQRLAPFWQNRLIEAGMILSLGCYYVVGNGNLGGSRIFTLNPLLSLPFLLLFALLAWYRLPFAVALLPITIPYYYFEKPVYSHYQFELAEIVLGVCIAIALIQFFFQQNTWQYRLSWREVRDRLGPFAIPILVFVLAAAISVGIAFARRNALRAFHEEIVAPLLYLLLAFYCLRARQDVARLLLALFTSAFIITVQGLVQYYLFRNTIAPDPDGVRRVHALFGSANNIGLFFDYSLPIGIALLISGHREVFGRLNTWGVRIMIGIALLPMLLVLYLSQSGGAWVAIACATVFIVLFSLPNRRMFWLGCLGLLVVLLAGGFVLRHHIIDFLNRHLSFNGVSTFTKRLYLWESALKMIRDRPLFGFGMDNWLCFYSANHVCVNPTMNLHHYWVLYIPGTHTLTGLSDEPTLSHPHNIFLQVWVSMGIFGLLAFVAVLALITWLFTRILKTLRAMGGETRDHLRWMVIGVGASLLAAMIQGQV